MKTKLFLKVLLCCTAIVSAAHAEEIGSVDTEFKLLGPDHKIVIEAFDDPKIEGITCHLSRSKKVASKVWPDWQRKPQMPQSPVVKSVPFALWVSLKKGKRYSGRVDP